MKVCTIIAFSDVAVFPISDFLFFFFNETFNNYSLKYDRMLSLTTQTMLKIAVMMHAMMFYVISCVINDFNIMVAMVMVLTLRIV